jgi:type II secretory pathway pseudopilin PulG
MPMSLTIARNKRLIGAILLVVVFLVGFVPQFLEARRIRNELQSSSQQVMALERDLRMAELRDLSGMILLEALRQNYGLARDYSTRYFERLQEAVAESSDPATTADLRDLLGRRDSITAVLAQSDPASLTEIQALYGRTHEVTRRP